MLKCTFTLNSVYLVALSETLPIYKQVEDPLAIHQTWNDLVLYIITNLAMA